MQRPDSFPTFLLDECLPYQIADMLKEVGCHVTSVKRKNLGSTSDGELIKWMGEREMAWITKDGAARTHHAQAIEQSRICVVWVKGMQRGRRRAPENMISKKDLLHMLVAKIDDIGEAIRQSRGPLYFLLYLSASRPSLTKSKSLQELGKRKRRK